MSNKWWNQALNPGHPAPETIINLATILQNFMYVRMPTILKHIKNIFAGKALIKHTKVKAIYSQEPGYFYVTLLLQLTYAHASIDFS